MASINVTKRLVVCVDGTWYDEDGLGHGNLSNVFRVKVSIKSGRCKLQDGTQAEQTVKYFHGIGVDKKPIDKFNDGITGDGCKEQIAAVFKECCDHLQKETDERWMFGFSRGAYVVRTVAGLLQYLQALSSSGKDEFEEEYKKALRLLPKIRDWLVGKRNGNEGKASQKPPNS